VTRSSDLQFHSILVAAAETPRADGLLTIYHDTYNDIVTFQVSEGSPLPLSLRI
jgi:hypothetical protein